VKLAKQVLGTGLAIAIATGSLPASAHHSYAMFDVEKDISVEGTVKQFMWTNPHSWIRLEVMDAKGQSKEWPVEMGSLTILVKLGWNPKTLQPGDKIRMTVHPMKSGLPGGDFVTLDSGGHNAIKNDGGTRFREKERAAHRAEGNS
jgi:phage-related protein